jgi:hypothetical protein
MNSNDPTGQWNQILCRPLKTLIRHRKPATARITAMGRGRLANQSETKRIHVDGLMSVANPWGPSLRGCNRIRPGRGAFVYWQPASPSGSAAHGHSITDYGSNVFHLLLAGTVEAKG